MTGAADVVDDRGEVPRMPIGVPRDGGPERRAALAGPPQRGGAVGLPSRTPRFLVTANASFVRREIASRSACANSAMIPTVRSFASGRSTPAKPRHCPAASAQSGVARQPVELGEDERRPGDLGEVQRFAEGLCSTDGA